MAKRYPDKHITWYYPEQNEPIGVGEALVPKSSQFLDSIGVSHSDILRYCNGTLKLGIKFEGFYLPEQTFVFPFGIGEQTKHNTSSVKRIIETDKIPSTILDYPDVATHFRATELTSYLDGFVHTLPNLTVYRRAVTKEELDGTYDLLIDSTGFKRQLSYIPNNFVDLKDVIPNNCALTTRVPYTNKAKQCKPYSTFKAMTNGWCWHIPLGDCLTFGYVHDNRYNVEDEFIEHVSEFMEIDFNREDITKIDFVTGRNEIHLNDNVVSIGLASAFIEPLESTGIYFIVSSIERLSKYIDNEITANEYNQETNKSFDDIANFIVAHYKYSARDNAYWKHYKELEVEQYKETDIFPREAWQYILSGFGLDLPLVEKIDALEQINIYRGMPFYEWLENEKHTT